MGGRGSESGDGEIAAAEAAEAAAMADADGWHVILNPKVRERERDPEMGKSEFIFNLEDR